MCSFIAVLIDLVYKRSGWHLLTVAIIFFIHSDKTVSLSLPFVLSIRQISVTLRRMNSDEGRDNKSCSYPNVAPYLETDTIDNLQNCIAEELKTVFEKCSFKVNQRLLLRDLFVSNIASPYLLAPAVAVVNPAAGGSLLSPTTLSPCISNMSLAASVTTSTSNLSSLAAITVIPDSGGVVPTNSKLKSNIFNNSVPPRRRPPIPSLSVPIKKDGTAVGIGDIPPVIGVTPPAVAAGSIVKVIVDFSLICNISLEIEKKIVISSSIL